MGINATSAEFLLQAYSSGVSFHHTLTLGRQNLSVNDDIIKKLKTQYAIPDMERAFSHSGDSGLDLPHPADAFFWALGAAKIDSLDADAYQCSTLVHDMNEPISPDLHQQYDCVIDGGTLEHIFAFPTAIRNCMEMVKPGGHLILMTPANNFFGHGFYQFSPELFFRVLSPDNGFCVERMVAIETENLVYQSHGKIYYYEESGRPYNILDPAVTGRRGTLRNSKMVLLYIQARRQADVPIFAKVPQQSDYVSLWHGKHKESKNQLSMRSIQAFRQITRSFLSGLKEAVPPYLRLRYHQRSASFQNRDAFR